MHEGHRRRLLGKIKSGEALYRHEVLEALLFSVVPRKDVNAEAHAVLDKFGDFTVLSRATAAEIAAVEGVGENMAEYIACLMRVLQRTGGGDCFCYLFTTEDFKNALSARAPVSRNTVEFFVTDKDGRATRVLSVQSPNAAKVILKEDEVLKILTSYKPFGVFVADRRVYSGCNPDFTGDKNCVLIDKVCSLVGARNYDYCIVDKNGGVYSYFVNDRLAFGNGRAV